jgi:hypothetical protein
LSFIADKQFKQARDLNHPVIDLQHAILEACLQFFSPETSVLRVKCWSMSPAIHNDCNHHVQGYNYLGPVGVQEIAGPLGRMRNAQTLKIVSAM